MRSASVLAAFLSSMSGAQRARAATEGVDVVRCELNITVRAADLAVATTLRAKGAPPRTWVLELVPEMKVLTAESGGVALPHSHSGAQLTLDLGGVRAAADGTFAVTLRCEGAPSERFSPANGGFVRSEIGAEMAYVRSQVAWYPRVAGDPAEHRIVVDAPAAREVRSAGDFEVTTTGERRVWTFASKTPLDRVGFAAGPWSEHSSGTFDALTLPGRERTLDGLLALTRKALEFHAGELGPLSRSRFALVEMPASFGAASGYSEHGYFLLGPRAFEEGADAAWVRGFVAHEAAHQWWGMEASFRDFANEALAEFAALRFLEASEGADAARRFRRAALDSVVASAAAGHEIALAKIDGWGAGLDPALYHAHAYDKAVLILAMVERELGREAMTKLLARFFAQARARRAGWTDLRDALCAAGSGARTIVEQWEVPGIPSLKLEHEAKKSGGNWSVTGKLTQSGTAKPFAMTVVVVARCGGERVATEVELKGASASFRMKTPALPDALLVDPDRLVLAAREGVGGADPRKVLEAAMRVANSPAEKDPAALEKAIGELRELLASVALSGGEEGAAHTGIGRCLFRLGKLDEAEKELVEALRLDAGGPFHRGWAHLRLGCIADLRGDREAALARYRAVIDSSGSSQTAVEKAKTFVERAYRGFDRDG